jgi:hypothetical protein
MCFLQAASIPCKQVPVFLQPTCHLCEVAIMNFVHLYSLPQLEPLLHCPVCWLALVTDFLQAKKTITMSVILIDFWYW